MLSPDTAPAVTIIGGPVGAGKTTLRDHLLRSSHGLRVAVLDNVDGPAGEIDLVSAHGGELGTLRGGCICCSLRGELVAAILGLIVAQPAPEHIIVETSGAADPGAIAEALGVLELRGIIRHTSVLAVFDAEQFTRTTYERDHRRLLRRQLRGADVIVLGHTDRVEAARLADVEAALRARLHRARILVAQHGRVAPELVFGVGQHEPDLAHAAAGARPGFVSWRYTSSEPLAIQSLRRALDEFPTGIFRVQGVARLAEAPSHRALIQMVGPRSQIVLGAPWGSESPRSSLVFIAQPGGLDEEALRVALDACVDGSPRSAELTPIIPSAPWLRS
jgi:G3E family GTPase